MKNIKYILFTLLFLFFNVFCVNASCTDEELLELKNLADEIKITYKHLGKTEYEEGRVSYNVFDVNVSNFSDELYISLLNNTVKIVPENGKATKKFNNGTWNLEIYSNKCNEKISEIKMFIPKFNIYSLDPLCEGIDGNDFNLCGKYYEYDVSYESFKERVEHYRITHNIKNEENLDNDNNDLKLYLDEIIEFAVNYKFYFIGVVISLLVIFVIIIIIKRNKKRGVLE